MNEDMKILREINLEAERYGGPICLDSFWAKLRQNTTVRENSSHLLV